MKNTEIYIKYNNSIKKIKFKQFNKLIFKKFKNIVNYHLNLENTTLFINSNIITPNNFKRIVKNNSIIDINKKIKGGFIEEAMNVIGNLIKVILEPIVGPLVDIIDTIVLMGGLLGDFIKLFINLVEVATTIFDPNKVIDDVIFGIINGITSVFSVFIEKLDFSQSEADKTDSGGPFGVTEKKQAICMPPSFINLLILVLCPPLALFLYKGWTAFFLIIICALMTYYLYYFPGFIFAALYILC